MGTSSIKKKKEVIYEFIEILNYPYNNHMVYFN